jgi:MraZ protein
MDNQGRVLIMPETLKMAKIEKDMLIVGSLTKLEIWNPQVYQEYMNNMNMTLSDLAQEISFKDMFFDE